MTSRNPDMTVRDAEVEGSGNFDHLGFFNVHLHRAVHACLQHFAAIEIQPPRPGSYDHITHVSRKNTPFHNSSTLSVQAQFHNSSTSRTAVVKQINE